MAVTVRLEGFNSQKTINRIVNNDKVGLFMAETIAKHMKKYVPEDEGILATSYFTRPWEVEYTQPYSHYMYEGEVYSPSFPIKQGDSIIGFYSEKGVKKHPTGRKLKYKKALATDHWDVPTQKNQGKKISKELTEFLKR